MKWYELLVCKLIGKVIGFIGFFGLLFTTQFDVIARGQPGETGWLQTSGYIVFTLMVGLGYYVNYLLKDMVRFIEE